MDLLIDVNDEIRYVSNDETGKIDPLNAPLFATKKVKAFQMSKKIEVEMIPTLPVKKSLQQNKKSDLQLNIYCPTSNEYFALISFLFWT